jgi:ankyrin repeat protein
MSAIWGFGPALAASPLDHQLIVAAEQGDPGAVRRILHEGANIDARDGRQRTALMAAVQTNHVAAAKALIEAGADVNAKDEINDSPYLLAGARGYLEILRLTLALVPISGARTAMAARRSSPLPSAGTWRRCAC